MQITAEQLEDAFDWLCHRRCNYPDHADVWHLRFHWETERVRLSEQLRNESYRLSPLQSVQKADGEVIHLWSAQDALVLEVLSKVLAEALPISPTCTHVKGNGGLKSAVRNIQSQLPAFRFVLRTDVKSYYESIDHFLLMEKLVEHVKDRYILNLLWQYMRRTVDRGGLYEEVQRGISRGCPLSPLMGAFFLSSLDARILQDGLFYVCYTDDIVIMAPTRWKLRGAAKTLNRIFADLKLEKHPAKTFIGRIEKGFDFLGYHFSRTGLTVAMGSINKFAARASRLYEQEAEGPCGPSRLERYVR